MDFIQREIENSEVKTTLIDYVRQAKELASLNIEDFYCQMQLADFTHYVPGMNELEQIETVWKLSQRHGEQVSHAIRSMREIHDNPYHPLPEKSFLQIVAKRVYLMRPDLVLLNCSMLIPTKMKSYATT